MRFPLVLAALLGVLLPGSLQAAEPLLDTNAVPFLKQDGRSAYAAFIVSNFPRAFAVANSGAYGFHSGGTIEESRPKALASCAAKGGTDCAIYAEDLQIVWQGRAPVVRAQGPGLLFGDTQYGLTTDDRYVWYGPETARGVFVWGHGKGSGYDGRATQPQSYVRWFNNAGFDVVRFARAPFPDDADHAGDVLQAGLTALRQRGWRMIVAGGQSRGAWNSLQVLTSPSLADAVIAVSAASFKSASTQEAEMWTILHHANAPHTRVMVVQFRGDPYTDASARIATVREQLPSRVGALLTIAEPEGITGHSGGNLLLFSQRYGPCMLRFVLDKTPPTAC